MLSTLPRLALLIAILTSSLLQPAPRAAAATVLTQFAASHAIINTDIASKTPSFSYAGRASQPSRMLAGAPDVPALVVAHHASTATVAAGDTIEYTVTISNAGGGRAASLTLTSALASNMA